MKNHLTPARMTLKKKKKKRQAITGMGQDGEKRESLCTVARIVYIGTAAMKIV